MAFASSKSRGGVGFGAAMCVAVGCQGAELQLGLVRLGGLLLGAPHRGWAIDGITVISAPIPTNAQNTA
jgi:hypothetical protein